MRLNAPASEAGEAQVSRTGVKWSFSTLIPNMPKYLLCNADEGEPGPLKTGRYLRKIPHLLIEGMIISATHLELNTDISDLRREYPAALSILEKAIRDAYNNNLLGRDILGKGIQFQLSVFQGAGAYICGEETALIESMEGQRGQPRIKTTLSGHRWLSGKTDCSK